MTRFLLFIIALCIAAPALAEEGSFYANPDKLFSTRPSETKSLTSIKRFGPVGIGIDLIQPAFVMRISNIEEGSPADQTGRLKTGQIIESINGQALADIDPRMQLAKLLNAAEATDGVLKFMIKGEAQPIVVKVPVLGSYSKTWPLNCPKSDKIIRQIADHLATPESNKGLADIGMLFLLSTGEAKDTAIVGEWARQANKPSKYAWYLAYGGIALCEYYLRTGDQAVLPNIQKWADQAVSGLYLDGWAGRGGVPSVTYGNGHLNAAGTGVVTFMMLAKECGAEIPDHALLGALQHYYRYAGRGANPYGDGRVEVGFVDNGKNGLLAFAMAAAASLTPEGEDSVYAKARDVCAIQSFYTTSFMLHGHTGGGIGEIWRSAAMALMIDKRPKQYRDFMDSRQWHYDLSRRYDGSFGILGGSGYDKEQWGIAYTLAYTLPRKNLRIMGAPRSKFSKPYQLPKQPWGTQADNVFLTLDAVPDANGSKQDVTNETLAKDSSMQFIRWFHRPSGVTDEQIRQYLHHQDHNIRFIAANKVLGVNSGYIGWRAPGGEVRPELFNEFINHDDPRIRRAMFMALDVTLAKEKKTELLTKAVFQMMIDVIKDPEAAWSIKDPALLVISHAPADWIVPHVDLLLPYLQHREWWLQNAALQALTPIVADTRTYKKVLPAIGELVRTNQRSAITLGLLPGIRTKIKEASPEVHQLAVQTLRETYTGYAGVKTAAGGQDISSTLDSHLKYIAGSLAEVPGGLDVLYDITREKHPDEILPYKEFFLSADPNQFGPKLKKVITPIIMDQLVPEFVGKNRKKLEALVALEKQTTRPGGTQDTIDQLVALYQRAGHDEYNWRIFADLRNAQWSYHTFDPIASEQVPYDQMITRYRPVTLPNGMADWYAKDFNSDQAGWKSAKSPFGHYDGKIPTGPIMKCTAECDGKHGPYGCFAATPVNTLWDKEVLLMRGTFKLPKLKEGHRYRLRINDGDHVGPGGGHIVYINGREFVEKEQCNGRGSNGMPNGGFITSEFLDDFNAGEVTIAIKTFLRYNDKYKVKPSSKISQGKISIHFEEMKLPPMGSDLVYQSAALVPMTSAKWQSKQDRDNPAIDPEADKFRWDGKHLENPILLGQWQVISEVKDIAEFNPEKKRGARRPAYTSITFNKDGTTADPTWIWSGDVLMDLNSYQALRIQVRMQVRSIPGGEYLFIERGGFNTRNKPDWKSTLLVLERKP